jgi:hypothetical protein
VRCGQGVCLFAQSPLSAMIEGYDQTLHRVSVSKSEVSTVDIHEISEGGGFNCEPRVKFENFK